MSETHDKITAALFDAGKSLTVGDLEHATGLPNNIVRFALRSLRACGRVVGVQGGLYRLDNAFRTKLVASAKSPAVEAPAKEEPVGSVTEKLTSLCKEARARLEQIPEERAEMARRHAAERDALRVEELRLRKLVETVEEPAPTPRQRGLTEAQQETLDALRGGAKTARDLAKRFNITVSSACQRLMTLVEKGAAVRADKGVYEAI